MSDTKNKNITALRTFSDDVNRVKKNSQADNQSQIKEIPATKEKTTLKKESLSNSVQKSVEKINTQVNDSLPEKQPEPRPEKTLIKKSIPKIDEAKIVNDLKTIERENKQSILLDEQQYDVDTLSEGTIIEDKISNRWNLASAMTQAAKDWYEEKNDQMEKPPSYTIENAESRLETIKKAAQASKLAPTEDYDLISKKIKGTEKKSNQTSITIKDKAALPKPTWTHLIDDGEEDAKAENNKNEVLENDTVSTTKKESESTENKSGYANQQPETNEPKPKKVETFEAYTKQKENTVIETKNAKAETETKTPVDNFTKTDQSSPKMEDSKIAEEVKEDTLQTVAKKYNRTKSRETITTSNRFRLTEVPIYIFILVILSASLAGVGVSLMILGNSNQEEVEKLPSQIYTETEPITNSPTAKVAVDFNEPIMRTLYSQPPQNSFIKFDFYDNNNNLIVGEELAKLLVPNKVSLLARNINETEAGYTNQNNPYIIIKLNNFDILFAGLLSWEESMSNDLSPFFGRPVLQTLESNELVKPTFTDSVVTGYSARILKNENGEEVLMYVFLNQTTVLITKNRNDVVNLLPNLN